MTVTARRPDSVPDVPTARDLVQIRNPRTGHYVKIDLVAGNIIGHKVTPGPYKNIPVVGAAA